MKDFFKRNGRILLLLLAIIISLMLIGSSIVMMSEYSRELDEQAGFKGALYANETTQHIYNAIAGYENIVERIVQPLHGDQYKDRMDFASELNRAINIDNISDVTFARFFKDGVEYDLVANEYNQVLEDKAIIQLSKNVKEITCAGVVGDRQYSLSRVAYIAPIHNCPQVDSVVLFFSVGYVVAFPEPMSGQALDDSRFTGVCSEEGEILDILHQGDMELRQHNNIYEQLRLDVNDKSIIDTMRNLISNGQTESLQATISGIKHIISISSIKSDLANPFTIVSVYRSADIYSSGYMVVNSILGAIIIFSAIIVFVAAFLIISRRRKKEKETAIKKTDDRLDCPTKAKFEQDARTILSKNTGSSFAVVVIDTKHFDYLSENMEYNAVTQLLRYYKMIFGSGLQLEELYAYVEGAQFILLYHYRDKETLETRLVNLISMAANYNGMLPGNTRLNIFGGVYLTESKVTDDISKMLDMAYEAKDVLNQAYDFGTFHYYDERIHASNEQRDYIETRMEKALENNEFIVFFQPQYSIKRKGLDSCEALARWYNKEKDTYMQPGVFMPLFEANGFIVQLDKNIYEQVCKYIAEANSARQNVYPVGVNVSRVSALDGNFVNDYVAIKKRYNIPNGFITLEFPESFAMQDYDMFRDVVNNMHKNGIKVCIDDFGSGYASYRILKEIPMDEIKLDRLFLLKGIAQDRDDKILANVVGMARELNLKITQKGVETVEQLNQLASLGCNGIQGYYYAKPMRKSDYIDFILNQSQRNIFASATGSYEQK